MVSLAQLLILFDHALLAVLFLIALFCIVSVVLSSIWTSKHVILHRNRKYSACPTDNEYQDLEIVERTDTCYSVKNGTSVLYESDLSNVVWKCSSFNYVLYSNKVLLYLHFILWLTFIYQHAKMSKCWYKSFFFPKNCSALSSLAPSSHKNALNSSQQSWLKFRFPKGS